MTQITELKHEDKTRRQMNMLAVVGALVVVGALGVGWFASQAGGGSDSSPAVPASTPSAAGVTLQPGETIGTRLEIELEAKAPETWWVLKDGAYVYLDSDGVDGGMGLEIAGPVLGVFDPVREIEADVPIRGYAEWLRTHPSLTVLDDGAVTIDGYVYPQLVVQVAADAPEVPGYGPGVLLLRAGDMSDPKGWQFFGRGTIVTATVIADHYYDTMVVTTFGAESDEAEAELDAGLALVLSTMNVPK